MVISDWLSQALMLDASLCKYSAMFSGAFCSGRLGEATSNDARLDVRDMDERLGARDKIRGGAAAVGLVMSATTISGASSSVAKMLVLWVLTREMTEDARKTVGFGERAKGLDEAGRSNGDRLSDLQRINRSIYRFYSIKNTGS